MPRVPTTGTMDLINPFLYRQPTQQVPSTGRVDLLTTRIPKCPKTPRCHQLTARPRRRRSRLTKPRPMKPNPKKQYNLRLKGNRICMALCFLLQVYTSQRISYARDAVSLPSSSQRIVRAMSFLVSIALHRAYSTFKSPISTILPDIFWNLCAVLSPILSSHG